MEILVRSGAVHKVEADAVVIGLIEGAMPEGASEVVDAALGGAVTDLIEGGDLSGRIDEIAVLYPRGALPARRVLIAGLGKPEEFSLERFRRAAGAAATRARDLGAKQVASLLHGVDEGGIDLIKRCQAVVEGTMLALYRYPADGHRRQEQERELESLTLLVEAEESVPVAEIGTRLGERIAAGVNLARTLVDHPSNVATPTFLGETAQAIAAQHGLKCQVHDREWAEAQGMGSFLSVAQGAGQPPTFTVLEYDPGDAHADTLVLVGKGITFDSGGISIKPRKKMWRMKGDMGGGAAVLGAMKAIGAIKPPVRVVGLVPATDNMPGANAYKPGDVVRAMNGKTIEIRSTDAEGRMLLADALCFASRFEPAAVVDVATLTSACVIALGEGVAAGCFSTDDALHQRLMAASEATAEPLWPIPLFKEYREALKSRVADVLHTGVRYGQDYGGVGISVAFLKEFTDYPWAHVDMAGMALLPDEPRNVYTPKGATGFGVRLLVEFILTW